MKKQYVAIGWAVFTVAIAAGLLIHSLSSRRAALAEQDLSPPPEPGQPPVPFQGPPDPDHMARRQQPPIDPLSQNLFPPDLVMQFQDQIGLSNEQRQAILADLQRTQPRIENLHQRLQQEMAALGELLKQEHGDLAAILAQSDKVHDLEREIKRTHLVLLVGLKNLLTPEQQARLQEIKGQARGGAGAPNLPPAMQEKMQRLQDGIQRWRQNGRDPSPIAQAMQKFEPLIRMGQFKEAEAILDDALKLLR